MKLSKIYSDGMIIQRDIENIIEGYSNPEENIKLCFGDEVYESVCDEEGYFAFMLPAKEAGGPYEMTVSSTSDSIKISYIYFGDVFLLAGQSNMELEVSKTLDVNKKEIEGTDYPLIRMFQLPKDPVFGEPAKIVESGEWISADEESVMNFSALGFFFSKIKFEKDSVPVGLYHAAVGGTHIEAFMSEERLLKSAKKLKRIALDEGRSLKCICDLNDTCKMCYAEAIEKNKNPEYVKSVQKADLERIMAWDKKCEEDDIGLTEKWYDHEWSADEKKSGIEIKIPESWLNNVLKNRIGTVWVQRSFYVPQNFCERDVELKLGTIVDADYTYVNGVMVGRTDFFYPPRRYKIPSGLLTHGKNIITIRVIIDNNVGEFKEDMPYCLKADDEEITLEGEWCARVAAVEEPKGGMMFFNWQPTSLYNSMIYPVRNVNFDSALFYQGESNTRYPEDYEYLMKDMVKEWRSLLGYKLPIIFAKLPYFRGESWEIPGDGWENLRDAQQRACDDMEDAYIVDLFDLGIYNEIHPQNKKEVAQRFFDEYRRYRKIKK